MFHLTETHSSSFVKDAGGRHVRLCYQNIGGEKYALLIKGPMDDFILKLIASEEAEENVKHAVDSAWLAKAMLSDVIRKVQGRAKEYDKEHPGSKTLTIILPEGNITEIVTASLEEEPIKANEVAVKITTLGNTHTLYPLAAEINTAVANVNARLELIEEAETALKNANALEEVSKIAVVRQYNANYHLAASDVDKYYAEKLFPRLSSRAKEGENS